MITISEKHYHKLVSIVELLHSNVGVLFPNVTQVQQVYQQWKTINEELVSLSKKVMNDLQEIKSKNASVMIENGELKEKVAALTLRNEELLKSNTIHRAELAKNASQNNRLKELVKIMKTTLKEKEETLKTNTSILQEVTDKYKKYKKLNQDQVKKVEKLEQMVAALEVTQRSSAKGQELDQQMQDLQAQLLQLQGGGGDKE